MEPKNARYKFVGGNGDDHHASKLNVLAAEGYKAILISPNEGGRARGENVVVLMEKEQ